MGGAIKVLVLGGRIPGHRGVLRTTAASDLADHVRWHADLGEVTWMPARPRVQSLGQRAAWLEGIASDPARWHWEIDAVGSHVGYTTISLAWAPFAESWVWTHMFIATPFRRRGIGTDVAIALHRFLIEYLGLRRGETWLYADDPAGRALADGLGYEQFAAGHRALYRGGRYWDSFQARLTAQRFGELHAPENALARA